jgi:hypothetical protein
MISLELITKYLSALDNYQLDKTEIKTLVNLLKEFENIPSEIERFQLRIIELIDDKAISGYIELDDRLYHIERNKLYNIISIDHANSKEFIELEKEIEDSRDKLDDYIRTEDERIEKLCLKMQELYDCLASVVKNQTAIDSDGYVFVNKDNNFYHTIDN